LFLVGCVSLPVSNSGLKEIAESLIPPDNMAGIYVIDPWSSDITVKSIKLNNLSFGTIAGGYYLYGWVPSGEHKLYIRGALPVSKPYHFKRT
jgi:hypothetical protein